MASSLLLPRLSLHPRGSSPTISSKNPSLLPHSLQKIFSKTSRVSKKGTNPASITVSASYSTTPATDRLIAAGAYFLPFIDGLQYGRFAFVQYPVLEPVFSPLFPVVSAYRSVPLASFVAFFAVYLVFVRNPKFSRFVRFNAMQALVIDVVQALPLLIQRIFTPGGRGLGFQLLVLGYNAFFAVIVGCFLYCLSSAVLGRIPYLPFIADAADRQL